MRREPAAVACSHYILLKQLVEHVKMSDETKAQQGEQQSLTDSFTVNPFLVITRVADMFTVSDYFFILPQLKEMSWG